MSQPRIIRAAAVQLSPDFDSDDGTTNRVLEHREECVGVDHYADDLDSQQVEQPVEREADHSHAKRPALPLQSCEVAQCRCCSNWD